MGQNVTALVLGAPDPFTIEDREKVYDRDIDLPFDEDAELICIPITSRADDREDIAAVALDEIAAAFADRISEARAEWAELTTRLAALDLVLPSPRLYLTTIEVA